MFGFLRFTTLVFFAASCLPYYHGYNSNSSSSKSAKKANVYVTNYRLIDSPVTIADSILFNPEEIWLERRWKTTSKRKVIEIDSGYTICMNLNLDRLNGFFKDWSIEEITYHTAFTFNNSEGIKCDFESLPKDSLVFIVHQGRWLDKNKKPIGKLVLVKTL